VRGKRDYEGRGRGLDGWRGGGREGLKVEGGRETKGRGGKGSRKVTRVK